MEMLRRARAEQPVVSPKQLTPTVRPPDGSVAKPEGSAMTPAATTNLPGSAAKDAAGTETNKAAVSAPITPSSTVAPAMALGGNTLAPPVAPSAKSTEAPSETGSKAATTPAVAQTKSAGDEKIAATPATTSTPGPAAPATLLLALETSGTSKKIEAASSFDPVLCLNETCFVSAGLSADAVKISKSDVIKLKSTDEASPDACRGKIACVFRNVPVPAGAQLQLIELGSASHEAASAPNVKIDESCKVSEGVLGCDDPIATPDFSVWIVPESTAKVAGSQAIEDAVADGLPHVDVARSTDK
jgi:hypothetical protein